MKEYLIALCLTLTLALPAQAAGQRHRHTPVATVQKADSTQQADELEAFSDTTSTDSSGVVATTTYQTYDLVDEDDAKQLLKELTTNPSVHRSLIEGITVMGILLIIFVLAPLILLGLIFFFIYKNRKQKVRLAEEAMRNGQPIPDQLFNEQKALAAPSDLRAKGIRQTCLGVGLMIFLGNTAGEVGFGVGALVTAIGVGNLLIARRNSNQ